MRKEGRPRCYLPAAPAVDLSAEDVPLPAVMTAPDLRNPVGRVRAVGMVEGISWLVLLFICVPLKRIFDMPMGVKIVGPIHGGLFLLFLFVIFQAWGGRALSSRQAVMAGIASLIPFGPFLIDRKLAESTPAETEDSPD